MNTIHVYALCPLYAILYYFCHVVYCVEFIGFRKANSFTDLKCNTSSEVFLSMTPVIFECIAKCLGQFGCLTVFYHQVQGWCQGCSSTTTTVPAVGTVSFSTDVIQYQTCSELLDAGATTSGVYIIKPSPELEQFIRVYCDMETLGGGWTVIQRRFDGSVDFYQRHHKYRIGFGDASGEHWMGLKYVTRALHNDRSELYMELEDHQGNVAYERYADFYVGAGGSNSNHSMSIGQVIDDSGGDTTNVNLLSNNGMTFSTFDMDWTSGCPVDYHGAWWYTDGTCTDVNPNGHYATPGTLSSYNNGKGGLFYKRFRNLTSLKATKIMFRTMNP